MDETLSSQSVLNKASDDKFIISLDLPPILRGINTSGRDAAKVNLNSLQFSVEGTIVPSISVPSIPIGYGGQNLEVTSYARPPYEKNRVRFTVDNRFNNWWVLWKWLDVLNDSKLSIFNKQGLPDVGSIKTLHSYQTDISVFAMDEYNNKIMQFKYVKAFITGLGGIEYDYQKHDHIKSTFEFAYSQLHVEML